MSTVQGRRAGRLDRKVDLYKRGTSVDSFGDVQDSYTVVQAGVWADFMQTGGKEFFAAEHDIEETKAVFRVRWRATFPNVTNRVVYLGRNWDVVEVREIGRRQYVDIYCKLEPHQ